MKASGVQPKVDDLNSHGFMPREEMVALVEKYQHPILKKYGEMAKEVGGHGGMDFIMDSRLVYCLQNGLPLDMDVYGVAWQNWVNSLWTMVAPLLHFLTLPVVNGIR